MTERGWERKRQKHETFPQTHPHRAAREVSWYRFPPFLPSVWHYGRRYCNKFKGKRHQQKRFCLLWLSLRKPLEAGLAVQTFFPSECSARSRSLFLSLSLSLPLGGSTNESTEREKACELRKSLSSSCGLAQHFSLQCLRGLWEDLWHFIRWGYFPNQRLSVSKSVNAAI